VLVVAGFLIVGIGVALMLGVPLGGYSATLVYRRGGATVYLPIATSALLSIVLSLVLMFVRR